RVAAFCHEFAVLAPPGVDPLACDGREPIDLVVAEVQPFRGREGGVDGAEALADVTRARLDERRDLSCGVLPQAGCDAFQPGVVQRAVEGATKRGVRRGVEVERGAAD